MSLRFRSHGRFQQAVLALSALGGAAGLVLWALQLATPQAFMVVVLGAVAGWLAHAARVAAAAPSGEPRRWADSWPELLAAAAAVPACLTTPLLFGGAPASPFTATVAGWSAGLVAGLGQLAAQLEIVPDDAVADAAGEGRALSGAELSLATRARAAWRHIRAGAAEPGSVEARRLDRLAERLTIQVLLLAARSHALGIELRAVDAALVRERVVSLSRAAARAADPAARADLDRAARETAAIEERWRLSCAARDRVLARLELQTTLLESTALAVAARRASAVADDAGALAPLCASLGDAAGELQVEATALAEIS